LKHRRPDVVIKGIRGNVETRLQKLSDGAYDALVMARAGFERLGLKPDHMVVLSTDEFVPAGGQGALVVQARANDRLVRELAGAIDDPVTRGNLEAEREVLRLLDAGCAAAVGVSARVETVERVLSAVVLDKAGCKRLHSERRVSVSDSPDGLARAVADELLARGAADLIADE